MDGVLIGVPDEVEESLRAIEMRNDLRVWMSIYEARSTQIYGRDYEDQGLLDAKNDPETLTI